VGTLAPRPKPFPVVPLLAAGLIVAGLGQLAWWAWQNQYPNANSHTTVKPAANPFSAVIELKQRHASAKLAATQQPQQLVMPATPPLMVLGNPTGPVTLTAFIDPSQLSHRRALNTWLTMGAERTRLELRFVPTTANNLSAGLMFAVARQRNQTAALWQQLATMPKDLDTPMMMEIMAQNGVSLKELRALLSQPNPAPLQSLQPDIAWARANQITPPTLLMDGYRVALPLLNPARLNTYISRRLKGEALVQPSDFLIAN
jgi:hypothetical protein